MMMLITRLRLGAIQPPLVRCNESSSVHGAREHYVGPRPCARYGGQSGIKCTSREPHAEQTNRRDLANATNGVSGSARMALNALLL